MKWGREKDPREGRLILQPGAGRGLWASSTKKAPGLGLWPGPSPDGENRVWLSAVLVLVLQILVEDHLLVHPLTNDRFLEANWRLRFSTLSWWPFLH